MARRAIEELEAIEATLIEALAKRRQISFVTVFKGCVSSICCGHAVIGIDLENKIFKTDSCDDWIDFGVAYCLVWGDDDRVCNAATAKERVSGEDLTLDEAEAALA